MIHQLVLTLLVSSLMLWRTCDTFYRDKTEQRILRMMNRMALELLKDAQMKVTAIQFYRDQYYKSFEYQLAEMVYHMRDKFKKIVIFYQLTSKNISEGRLYHRENIHTLTRIQQKGMEIDNLILMAEEMLIKKEKKGDIHERMKVIIRTGDHLNDKKLRAAWKRADAAPRPSELLRLPRVRNATARSPRRRRRNGKWEYVPTGDHF